jgi:uracil phosphoribosyltransferase
VTTADVMAAENTQPIPHLSKGVGPFYRLGGERPIATISKDVYYENVHVLPQTPQLIALLTYEFHLVVPLHISDNT